MKNQNETFETTLSFSGIDECSERVRSFLNEQKISKSDLMRFTLTVEEILLKTSDTASAETKVSLNMGTRFFRPYICLEIEGKANNVFSEKGEEQSVLKNSILQNLGLSPEYSYSNEVNRYFFRIRKKTLNPFLTLIIVVAAAIITGLIGFVIPDGIRSFLFDGLLTPLHDTFLNILGCIAGPMIFLSVAWGIYGIGDAATLKRIGKRMLTSYMGTVYLFIIFLGLMSLSFFNLNFSGNVGNVSQMSSVFSMILGIIPQNIVSPFVDGNTLQIIFLAVVFGVAMLFLGSKTNAVAKAVEQINYIVQFLIEFISKLVPYFIYIVLVRLIWSDNAGIFISVFKLFAVFGAMVLVMSGLMIFYTSLKNQTKPVQLIKKGLPSLFIAITTASSAATFGSNMSACRKEYGIDDKIISFGIPLGMVSFKPTTALAYVCVSLFFAQMYNVEVSVSWIIIMMFSAGILALATPPIPGGAITAYTVLFTQLGIPVEAIAVALACDTLLDFVCTGFDQFLLPFAVLNQANRLGMVDKTILKKKKHNKRERGKEK